MNAAQLGLSKNVVHDTDFSMNMEDAHPRQIRKICKFGPLYFDCVAFALTLQALCRYRQNKVLTVTNNDQQSYMRSMATSRQRQSSRSLDESPPPASSGWGDLSRLRPSLAWSTAATSGWDRLSSVQNAHSRNNSPRASLLASCS
eukprot:2712458-Amphidinium_carterae.1